MSLTELLAKLDAPIVIRPTRRMTQGERETNFDKAADILRGNADPSEFHGYVFALLFYKRISDCYEEEVRTQVDALSKAGMPRAFRRLQASGVIRHIRAVLDPAARGRPLEAQIEVKLAAETAALDFETRLRHLPQVVCATLMTGWFDYAVRVAAPTAKT